MSIGEKILSRFGYHKGVPITWMSWKGDCDTPGFTISLNEMTGLREAYCKCSPVSTIINRLASSMANGEWWIIDKKGENASDNHKDVFNLINNPNPLQTRTELVQQMDMYRNLYGITYLYAIVPIGYTSVRDAISLWAVNPERITPVFKNGIIYNAQNINEIIEKYVITIGGTTIDVNPEHILTIRDSYGSICSHDKFSNISRISGLHYEVRNIIQAQEAIYALSKDRGAQGIITNKTKDVSGSVPLSPEEKKQIQDDYQKRYGLNEGQAKVIISDSDLGWQQMSFNVKDLMLFEGIKQNIESISDALNYPFELLANQNGTTFANRSEAIKYLYQDNIIPRSNLYEEKYSNFFQLGDDKFEIDFSHIAYLKEDENKHAEARLKRSQSLQIDYKLGIITREEYRLMQDLDEKPQGNTFYTADNGKENTE